MAFELSSNCNLNCKFCDNKVNLTTKKIDFVTYKNTIDSLAKSNIKINSIRLDGNAEALTYGERLNETVVVARHVTDCVYIITNGVLLNETISGELLKSGLNSIVVSFTGPTREIYRQFQGSNLEVDHSDRQFNTVINNITGFIRKKRELNLNTVVVVSYLISKDTIPYKKKFEEFCREIGVNQIDYSYLLDERSSTLQKRELLKRIKQKKNLCKMVNTERITPFIYADGYVYPCCATRQKELCLGNIYTDSLVDVLRGEKIMELINILDTGSANMPDSCFFCPLNGGYGNNVTYEVVKL